MTNARVLAGRLADLLSREHGAMADFLVALADFDRRRGWAELGYSSLTTAAGGTATDAAAACTAAATFFACGIAHPGGRQTAGLDSGWWLLPMAARIRGHLRLDTVCRVRPSDSARIGRALDRGQHPSAVQVPQ